MAPEAEDVALTEVPMDTVVSTEIATTEEQVQAPEVENDLAVHLENQECLQPQARTLGLLKTLKRSFKLLNPACAVLGPLLQPQLRRINWAMSYLLVTY
eukprot:jgi/Chrzof1/1476/Cz10g09090.t1